MKQISFFLQKLGFKLKVHSDGSFNGWFTSNDGFEIYVLYFNSNFSMQAKHRELTKIIIDCTIIKSVYELVFFLSRNSFLKSQFKTLYAEMIQSQILQNVEQS